MAFHEVQFPTRISLNATGGPGFNTTVLLTTGGHEKRNINWEVARRRYSVSFPTQSQTDFDEVLAFYVAREGMAHGFRFKDWSDYKIENQSIGTADGAQDLWQIFKRYTSGGINFDRDITKPVAGTLQLQVGGSDVVEDTDYTLDTTTGIIDFSTSGSPSVATAGSDINIVYCEFDVPVRFDFDLPQWGIPQDGPLPNISIVEIRI